MKGKFICFIGIDGSGKTTLVNETMRHLKERGMDFRYVWGSHEMWLLGGVIRAGKYFLLGKKDSRKDYKEYLAALNKVGKNGIISMCYKVWMLCEYMVQMYVKISIPLCLGRNIVSDRYVYDTVINVKVNLGMREESMLWMLKVVLKFLPRPDTLFFVDVPEEIAFSRKKDTPSIDYLKVRRTLYGKISKEYNAIVIDGGKPRQGSVSQIESSLGRVFFE